MALYIGNKKVTPIKVTSGGGSSEWQPDPEWWDIKTILEEDTRDYAGKAIILYFNSDDFTNITISSPCVAIGTSDGGFYTSRATHTWDRTKDKESSIAGIKTRYLILYFNSVDIVYTALNNFKSGSIYAVFGCNLTKPTTTAVANSLFYGNPTLQYLDFIDNYNFNFGENWKQFGQNCSSLRKLPEKLDVSMCKTFDNFCQACRSLTQLPDNFNTSSGTTFISFLRDCVSVIKLPDNLDTSKCTNFNYFCGGCYSLRSLPKGLDTSSGTNFNSFCQTCTSLIGLSDKLDVSNATTISTFISTASSLVKANINLPKISTSISSASVISIDSLRYIADNAPTVSSATLTIGLSNITRAGGASGYVVQTLTSKGWTVN